MEQIKSVVQRMSRLPDSLQTNLELSNEISIYKGELTGQCLTNCVIVIKKAFPSLPIGFYDVFTDRLRDNGFTDDRLMDAVNYVIDTCIYPTPTIANFIGFDRKYKIFTYEDMIHKGEEFGPEIWKSYKQVKLPGREKPVWVHVDDMKIARLTEYTP